jgi:FAD/FMN-containing dehydrogenase
MKAPVEQTLSGWGGFGRMRCRTLQPGLRSGLEQLLEEEGTFPQLALRGRGRSYGDSAVDARGVVIDLNALDRILGFDRDGGLLRCEAGLSLGELIPVILPHGWFLPTTPGTRFVSLGGAVAADVHGKNHHQDGSFGQWIRELVLRLANGETVRCSPLERPDLFYATIGGMGLTGCILEVTIQLRRVASAYYRVRRRRCGDLESVFAAFEEADASHRYSVGWVDASARGRNLGRSALLFGNEAAREDLPKRLSREPFTVPSRLSTGVPFTPPAGLINRFSTGLFNRLYYRIQPDRDLIRDYGSFFYPLDGLSHWNRLYGPRGFIQYQAVLPPAGAETGIRSLLETIQAAGYGSFLAVIKRSGPGNPFPLSFLFEGYTLAIDLPVRRGRDVAGLTRKLDAIVLDRGGRLYLAKDSLMDGTTFRKMYPGVDRFLEVKRRYDPRNRFMTAQARRLGLEVHP